MLKQIDFTKLPITDIVNEIIYTAAEAGASDIHFDPTETTVKVRFRIDGILIDYTIIPENIRKNLIARLKIISGMDITESRLPQDGAIKTTIKNLNLDMRVSSLPTNEGEKIVIRILDYSASLEGLESLGFTPTNLKKMKELIKEPNGIILVTGATGSGKSTTVYSLLQILNTSEVNLVTVEDPVEMNVDGINQIQVNSEIGLTFANVLRSILRQDPDIIMIGEIRDDETAKIAVRASITGHLVLSTIHTNNALNTIERLTDMDVERYLLASSLNGIVSQKLARRICPKCKKTRPAIAYEKKLFKLNLNVDITELSYAEGCPDCVGGYKGRIAVHEVLVITQEIRDAIANGMSKEKLRTLVYKKEGTTTLLQDGLEKVLQGITTLEEILRIVELDDENTKIVENMHDLDEEEASNTDAINQLPNNIPINKVSENNTPVQNNYVNGNVVNPSNETINTSINNEVPNQVIDANNQNINIDNSASLSNVTQNSNVNTISQNNVNQSPDTSVTPESNVNQFSNTNVTQSNISQNIDANMVPQNNINQKTNVYNAPQNNNMINNAYHAPNPNRPRPINTRMQAPDPNHPRPINNNNYFNPASNSRPANMVQNPSGTETLDI